MTSKDTTTLKMLSGTTELCNEYHIWIKVCSCVQTLISLKDTSAVILLQVNNNQNDDILNCS